ncbi:MAG: TIGR02452 family protein [Burkholderiales bacterium]|nr:TIGR02452 family protein [Burkholderiales bacterium]
MARAGLIAVATAIVAAGSAEPVLVLNFASAKNPGGGFLSGSQAQEESLARSSGLYASQMQAWDFYERHRANPSCLYSHAMIYSPACPVFADDDGHLLEQAQLLSFVTSAAPNAGAVASNHADDLPLVPVVLKERAELVLTLARAKGYQRLLLGAWGCGVFRNDPQMVARSFIDLLRSPAWDGQFSQILFSVRDHSREQATFHAFQMACDQQLA